MRAIFLAIMLFAVPASAEDKGPRVIQEADKVVIRKPDASRKRSPEVYALGQGKRIQIK